MDLGKLQTDQEWFGAIECILFVSGEPVDLVSLQRALGLTELEVQSILGEMEESYAAQERGIQTNWNWNCQIPFCDFVLPINQPIGWT